MTLSGMAGSQLLVLPAIAISGLAAHVMAEGLLNAPRLLGSLELLGNPAGLVNSLAEGLQDFLSLSLAARSPSTVRAPSTSTSFLAWLSTVHRYKYLALHATWACFQHSI